VRGLFPESTGYSWLTAALTLSLMILPTIVLLVHTQFQQVDPGCAWLAPRLDFPRLKPCFGYCGPLAARGL
jgi:phosphate transport system permease protein